jgi:NAD(P)-dependent dehydrogenase (short-subunit alcohol dehydrogenase family)
LTGSQLKAPGFAGGYLLQSVEEVAAMKLDRSVALVTGASSGIGQATALELAGRDYAVAVHYFRNERGADETLEQIRGSQGEAFLVKADVRNRAEVERMVDKVLNEFGKIDVLVNNAGTMVAKVPFLEMTDEHWHEVFAVNVDSVFYCAQAVARSMVSRKSGIIINVSSLAARNGGAVAALAYASAKGAVLTFTMGLAKELAPFAIRVNGVAPGVILTEQHERFTPNELFKSFVDRTLLKRAGTPKEIASVIAFLASPDASYLTGETIEVNGGIWMH